MTNSPFIYMSDECVKQIKIILKEVCGASDSQLEQLRQFIFDHYENTPYVNEYRFCGNLGFGGKFRFNDDGEMYVTCYPEDETPERLAMIEKARNLLFLLDIRK